MGNIYDERGSNIYIIWQALKAEILFKKEKTMLSKWRNYLIIYRRICPEEDGPVGFISTEAKECADARVNNIGIYNIPELF